MPFLPKFTLTPQIAASLVAIERTRGFLEGAPLPKEWICKIQDNAMILEAHHSTHIEGTSLSLTQAAKLIQGEIIPACHSEDVKKLLSVRRTLDFIAIQAASQEKISESLIKEIQSRIGEDSNHNNSQGLYRTTQNPITNLKNEILCMPPSPYDLPFLMIEFLNWLQNENTLPPVLIAGIAQFQLTRLQPFADGNGSVARLTTLLCLYKSGYAFDKMLTISEAYNGNRQGYHSALYAEQALSLDMTLWLEYFTKVLQAQAHKLQIKAELALKIEKAALKYKLSLRQKQILASFPFLQKNLKIQEFESHFPGIHRRALQRDLAVLIQTRLICQTGIKKGACYTLGAIE